MPRYHHVTLRSLYIALAVALVGGGWAPASNASQKEDYCRMYGKYAFASRIYKKSGFSEDESREAILKHVMSDLGQDAGKDEAVRLTVLVFKAVELGYADISVPSEDLSSAAHEYCINKLKMK